MKQTIKRMSGFRKNKKALFVLLVGMVILIIAINWYYNTDVYKEKVVSQALKKVGDIKNGEVQYDEAQDKFIIETPAFKLMPTLDKFILCKEISSRLNGETNFVILSLDKEYSCDRTGKDGLILFADGSQIYSDKESSKQPSVSSSTSSSSSTQSNSSRVADGYDWVSMTPSQKTSLVNRIIKSWESKGFTVSASNEWFVSNINDFYGEATYDFSVAEAASQIGTVGGVLK